MICTDVNFQGLELILFITLQLHVVVFNVEEGQRYVVISKCGRRATVCSDF